MLSKFSVKKPMTVFVAVVLVIVLGIVAFSRMTPDLLPNLDLPYQLILTTYPGQTPETVEMTVTKPLEQSVSVIDGVKRINSTSYDNYSVLIVEFEDGTNMDTATINVRSALDVIKDSWDDSVGSPYMLKINPNILPVAMTAVDYEGKDRLAISDFVENEILGKIEGIDGVASVSTTGVLKEKENIVLSQKKLDELNKKINAALDDQFAEAEDKLSDAKSELEGNISAAEDGAAVIDSSLSELENQQGEVAKKLADAKKQADNGQVQILDAKMKLLDQKTALTVTKQQLEQNYQMLLKLKQTYDSLMAEKDELEEQLDTIKKISEEYKELTEQLDNPDLTDEQRAEIQGRIEGLKEALKPYGIDIEHIDESVKQIETALAQVDASIEKLRKTLADMGTELEKLDETIKAIPGQIAQIDKGIEQIDGAVSGLDDKSVSVNDALALISEQQSNAEFKMSSANATLLAKQSEVNLASTQLESAKAELEKSADTIKDEKDKAKNKADANSLVTLDSVSNILKAQSFSMPAGYVSDDKDNRFMVRVGDEVKDEKELSTLALFDTKIDGIGVIRLSDVADTFVSDNSKDIYAKINGSDGVVLSFTKQSDIATSTVCDNINNELKKLEGDYDGLRFTNLYSQGDYIHLIIQNVLQNLLMGAGLAIIILLLFLRDIKPTVIVACSIPVSVIFAVVLMYFSGITLNMISLSGLAIGVGMLVDNSVVVIENTYRLRRLGYSAVSAALNGARQVAGAIAASTLTTICVFAPIVFVQGITRQIFVDMALTVTYSLLASLIVALTLVPALSQRVLRKVRETKEGSGRIMRGYEKSLRFVLAHKVPAILVAVALLISSGLLAFMRGFSFMPTMSTQQVQLTINLDDNPTFDDAVALGERLSKAFNDREEFETVGVLVGSSSSLLGIGAGSGSGGSSSNNNGSVMAYGVLKPDYVKKGRQISKELEEQFSDVNGDIRAGGAMTSMSTLIGDDNVQIYLYGDDLKQLKTTADDISAKLNDLDSIEEADSGASETSPEIKVTVDRQKAAAKGLTVAQVFQQVAEAVADEKTSTTLKTDGGKSLDVVVIKDEAQKTAPDKVGAINLKYTDKEGNEKKVSLSSVASISESESMDIITRRDQKRYVAITGTVKEGHTLTEANNAAQELMNSYELPANFTTEFAGSNAATMEAVQQLMLMMLLGVIMIYLIMVAQFQSLKSPFIIMFTIPLAFTGGFIGLLITGFDISVVSLIGFIMLCGIIVNNGIVLVDYINNLRLEGTERREAIVEAGKTRMRPILITALTTVLGLSVMALGIGTGAEMMQPLAIVCIGGLLYATFMTLYIIPAIYDAFNKKELRKVTEDDLKEIEE